MLNYIFWLNFSAAVWLYFSAVVCLYLILTYIYEPWHEISNNVVYGTSKASDQPGHTHGVIRAFTNRLNILWLLGYLQNIIWSYYILNVRILFLLLISRMNGWNLTNSVINVGILTCSKTSQQFVNISELVISWRLFLSNNDPFSPPPPPPPLQNVLIFLFIFQSFSLCYFFTVSEDFWMTCSKEISNFQTKKFIGYPPPKCSSLCIYLSE